ncbi:MAG TPA: ATP synthase F1 subunit delta [Terriglobales bacterium]|jgi:F-type H+-transporting ATPase subunit delta|nr:ATP synthase F1 subunit delta [Terriglobales bacterium]
MSVFSRYARAFADVVIENRLDLRQVEEQLGAVVSIVEAAPMLRAVWENPSIEARQKLAVLDQIIARIGASRMLRNFIAVLIDHRRVAALPEIARQFELELNERLGLADAEVTSARELSDPEKRALETRVAEVTGKKVRARYKTDSKVLGGAVVQVGSTIYDGSIRGQLEKLKEALSSQHSALSD